MTIEFGYEKKQVLDALRNHFFSRREIRILVILVNVFAILSAVLFYFKIIQPLSFLVFSLLWFLLWITIRVVLPSSIYKRSHTFQDHFRMSFEEEGVRLETERGEQDWQWKQFSAFKETLYFFHLYFDSRSFFLVPKDAFKDITDTQAARDLLRRHIKTP
jgi:YcxB-like protein